MPLYSVTGWRVVSQYATAEILAHSAEDARAGALEPDAQGYTPLDKAGFEDCGDPEECDEIRVTNEDTCQDELSWRDPDAQVRIAAAGMLAVLKEAVERNVIVEGADWWGRVHAAIARAEGR